MASNSPLIQLQLFKAIVEQTSDAIIFADRDGVIRVWNRGAEAVFGFAAGEAVGSSLDIIIPERFRRAHWDGFRKAVEKGHTMHGGEVRTTRSLHKAAGHTLYVELSFSLVTDDAGSVLGAVAVGRDCTTRYLAAREARAAPPPS